MKKLAILSSILMLNGCLHEAIDEPERIQAEIEYPPLSAQQAFDDLQLDSSLMALDADNAEELMTKALIRLLNIVEIANQETDIVAVNIARPEAVFKPGARSLTPITASSNRCKNEAETNELNTEALVWEDVNEDKLPLEGDKWYYILEQCLNEVNSSYVTGVILYSGMDDPFNQRGLQIENELFSDYQYTLDIQVEHQNEMSAFFDDTKLTISREINADNSEITDFAIQADSKMGVKSGDSLYMFKMNSLTAQSDDDEQTLSLSVDAQYLMSTEESTAELNIVSQENLLFNFEYSVFQNQDLTNVSLGSGELKISGANGSSLVLSVVDEETLEIAIDEDGDGETDDTVELEQTAIFADPQFKLLNITGG